MENILPPLQVFAMDENMERLTGAIPYKSLIWRRKYYEPGEFEMQVPADLFSEDWAYIYCENRPETGIVQKVAIIDDSLMPGGRDTVTVSGFFTESWLNRYVFLVEETEQEEYRIYKPVPATRKKPVTKLDGSGNLVTVYAINASKSFAVVKDVKSGATRKVSLADYQKMTDVSVKNGVGVREVSGGLTSGSFDYIAGTKQSSELKTVSGKGEEKTAGYIFGKENTGNASFRDVFYWENKADVGDMTKLSWIPSAAFSSGDTYKRRVESWEEQTKSLEKVTEGGSTYAIAYRSVKGAYQLRTEIDEVDKENDNVKLILAWAARLFGDSMTYDVPDFDGVKKILNPSLKRFGDLAYEELQTIGASVRCFYSFETNAIVFQVWRGLDRTQDQTANPWAVFNDDWGSLYGYSASRDVSNYRNKCYVLYNYDCPNAWGSDGKPATSWRWYRDTASSSTTWKRQYYIPYTAKKGYRTVRLTDDREDAEIYLDLRDSKPEQDDAWSRDGADSAADLFTEDATSDMKAQYTAFWDNLEAEGKKKLENDYADERQFDTGTLDKRGYIKSWDLGDVVDFAVSRLGLKETARITEIEETYDTSGNDLKVTIGETSLTTRKA